MKKVLIALYSVSGFTICALAFVDFLSVNGILLQQILMLSGLMIFGLMYFFAALVIFRKKSFRNTAKNAINPSVGLALSTLALLLGVALTWWTMSTQVIALHDIAFALVVITYVLGEWLDAIDLRRRVVS